MVSLVSLSLRVVVRWAIVVSVRAYPQRTANWRLQTSGADPVPLGITRSLRQARRSCGDQNVPGPSSRHSGLPCCNRRWEMAVHRPSRDDNLVDAMSSRTFARQVVMAIEGRSHRNQRVSGAVTPQRGGGGRRRTTAQRRPWPTSAKSRSIGSPTCIDLASTHTPTMRCPSRPRLSPGHD
jgi:hypothetical protein